MTALLQHPRLANLPPLPPYDSTAIRQIVDRDLAPLVDDIDRQGFYPETVLRSLGERGLFASHLGADNAIAQAIRGMAVVGEHCLSTAFLAWCQDTCGWYLHNTDNSALRQELLPDVASGRLLGGTGLSNPMKAYAQIEDFRLVGERVAGGYVVSGQLPWVSNLGEDHVFGTLFEIPATGRKVMALVRCNQPGVKIAQRAHFCALEGTRTLTVLFKRAFIADAQILADPAEPYLVRITPGFILLQGGMALGLIQGAINIIRESEGSLSHVNSHLPDQPELFEEALAELTGVLDTLSATPYENSPEFMRHVLEARLAAGEWTLRAAHAAMLHAGARGYLINAAAQRRLREAYFVAIVTPALKHLRKELAAISQGEGCMRGWKTACGG